MCCFSMLLFFLVMRPPPSSTLFPYTTLFRSHVGTPGQTAFGRADLDAFFERHDGIASVKFDQRARNWLRSEEHTSELQSHSDLVCRLLLEKKNSATSALVKSALMRSAPRCRR